MIESILAIIYLSYRRGKDDGKWGCLIVIGAIAFIGLVISLFD